MRRRSPSSALFPAGIAPEAELLLQAARTRVTPDRAARMQALVAEGYRPDFADLPGERHPEDRLSDADRDVIVEPHWAENTVPGQDLAALRARRRAICLAGDTVSTLPPEETLVHLCLHGSGHR